jgi:hypothetical protein
MYTSTITFALLAAKADLMEPYILFLQFIWQQQFFEHLKSETT